MLLAACSGAPSAVMSPTEGAPTAQVTVDSPELAALRAKAGLDPCVAGNADPVPGGLPSLTLPCLGGGASVDLASLRGPMVISMFASWCTYCPGEMPLFQKLKKEYAGRLTVMAIDFEDSNPAGALTMMQQQGADYAALADPGGDLHTPLRVRGLPGLILLHRDGTYTVGYFVLKDYASLQQKVEAELGSELRPARSSDG
jgi:thiol-disulfide isomerase/thioredoxin